MDGLGFLVKKQRHAARRPRENQTRSFKLEFHMILDWVTVDKKGLNVAH